MGIWAREPMLTLETRASTDTTVCEFEGNTILCGHRNLTRCNQTTPPQTSNHQTTRNLKPPVLISLSEAVSDSAIRYDAGSNAVCNGEKPYSHVYDLRTKPLAHKALEMSFKLLTPTSRFPSPYEAKANSNIIWPATSIHSTESTEAKSPQRQTHTLYTLMHYKGGGALEARPRIHQRRNNIKGCVCALKFSDLRPQAKTGCSD